MIGLLEMAPGAPHPVSGEGQIQYEALVPLAVRSSIILAGFSVWGLTAIYRIVAPASAAGKSGETHRQAAD